MLGAILGGIIGGGLVITLVGSRLPRTWAVRCAVELEHAPEVVWQVIQDVQGQPTWRRELRGIHPLDPHEGRRAWRENHHGGTSVRYEALDERPSVLVVRRIGEVRAPVPIRWEASLAPTAGGCRVEVTERAEVANPLRRFRHRLLADPRRFTRRYLERLAARMGQEAQIIDLDAP